MTKSSSEKLSKFLCPDYDGITEKHPHFKTFVEYIFRKPTLSTAPEYAEAVRDYRQVSDLIGELCENGHVDPEIEGFIQREIAAALEASEELLLARTAV